MDWDESQSLKDDSVLSLLFMISHVIHQLTTFSASWLHSLWILRSYSIVEGVVVPSESFESKLSFFWTCLLEDMLAKCSLKDTILLPAYFPPTIASKHNYYRKRNLAGNMKFVKLQAAEDKRIIIDTSPGWKLSCEQWSSFVQGRIRSFSNVLVL